MAPQHRNFNRISSVLVMLFILTASCKINNDDGRGPVAAVHALSTFQVADGFKLEMIASEPLISDPVDMEIDEYGRMYVVEMHGYPLDKSGSGKIILLSDADGNGIMDKRTVFKEGLVLPTSVMRWKKGILVTDAPNLLYLEDTDNDGKANVMDTVLHGFALSNPQHNVNSPVYGLDNWIYIAHEGSVSTREYKDEFGDEGSEIIFPGDPKAPKLPKNASGRSIRVKPDHRQLEMLSSFTQFGHTFDKWGRRFNCNNSNQGYQEMIANRYFERNKDLVIANATHDMSDHLNAAEVFPTTTHPDRQLLTNVGVMTSACGITTYLGDAFPAPYSGNVTFIAEPVSNLVHVDILKDSGSSFTASRILQNKEFLSSTDAWSRPVNLYVGPDGALYVLDYYRKVIESPEWMSEEAIKAGGLYDGSDKGRIFRISATNGKPAEWTKGLKLGDATDEELVKMLAHPNNWWRMNAQRLLVDRKNKAVVPALIAMTTNNSPLGRLHALWTLEGIGELRVEHIERALKDSEAGIRENAIQLAELHMRSEPNIEKSLLALEHDADRKVRFQLLLTLGFIERPEAAAVRNRLLFRDINDKWMQIAALSASASQTTSLLNVVLDRFSDKEPAYASLVERLTAMVGVGGKEVDIHRLIQSATTTSTRAHDGKKASMLSGLAEGLRSRTPKLAIGDGNERLLVKTFFGHPSGAVRNASLQVLRTNGVSDSSFKALSVKKAASIMADTAQPDNRRAEAIRFMGIADPSPYVEQLKRLIVPLEEPTVQLAALETFAKVKGTAVSEYVISQWSVLTPEIRDAAIQTFMTDSMRTALLINALDKDQIKPGHLSFSTSVELMQFNNEALRNKARTIFTKNERERKKVNKEYQAALELEGNSNNGKKVYMDNCAICHQVRGKMGVPLGPDLGTVHNWIKEDILANVLDPNLSISSGFDIWQVELNTGEKVQGIISSETPAAFTLKNNGKLDRTINRQDVKTLKALNASAMPTGFEKTINQQQMADLLAFLRQH